MCDTLVVKSQSAVWFAKNSDREPEEPQVIETHAPARSDKTKTVRATYMNVPQVPDRFGTILSRPVWIWGAEMGVNDQGVAIGNEAIFSKLVDRQGKALLGMDLLRFGLERGGNARQALKVITHLLEEHGQAGPAGYQNKRSRYDNSFLIADPEEAWVLETAGRHWVAKQVKDSWAISNTYSLTTDFDLHSSGIAKGVNFKRRFEQIIKPHRSRGKDRSALSRAQICAVPKQNLSLHKLANMLRAHIKGDGFTSPTRGNVCMHAKGAACTSQSTCSMIAKLEPGKAPIVAATGTPLPCISLFKPVGFDPDAEWLVAEKKSGEDGSLWQQGNKAAKHASTNPAQAATLRAALADMEPRLLEAVEAGDLTSAEQLARDWTATHYDWGGEKAVPIR